MHIETNKLKQAKGYSNSVEYWAQIICRIAEGILELVDKGSSILQHLF
jgi:hypothetical protein